MRILMLLSKPLTEDPRVVREARTLQDVGHEVVVLQWARFDPDALREGEVSGVPVIRFPLPKSAGSVPTTLLRTPFWWRTATKHATRLHREHPFDVVHAHDLDTLPVGVRMKSRHGIQLVYDAHEIFSHMIEADQPWPVPALADRLEHRLLKHADHMITAGDAFAEHYRAIYPGSISVVRNVLWDAPGPWRPPTAETFTVVYIGTLSRDRLFPQIVGTLGSIPGVHLVVGGKKEGAYSQVEALSNELPNVTFLGPVPHETVIDHTRRAHAVVVPMDPANRQYRVQLANKVFDAMTAGRPLIGIKNTATGEFCHRHGFGITTEYDETALREAVLKISRDPERAQTLGKNGHKLARNEYHWGPQGARLLTAYETLGQAPDPDRPGPGPV